MTSAIDSETLEMTLDAVQRFANDTLPEKLLLDLDADEKFPVNVVRDLCGEAIGIQLLFIPEEYGGMGGGAFDVYRVCETMARVDLGIATGVLATFLGSDPIRVGGTSEQQAHWMTRLAEEGLLMAYAATEPQAGSDLGALKTRADPVGDNGTVRGYRISGAKQWISNGGRGFDADVVDESGEVYLRLQDYETSELPGAAAAAAIEPIKAVFGAD